MDKVRTGIYAEDEDKQSGSVLTQKIRQMTCTVAVGATAGIRPLKRFDAKAYHDKEQAHFKAWIDPRQIILSENHAYAWTDCTGASRISYSEPKNQFDGYLAPFMSF